MDTTLAAGILTRLDVLAARMNVTTNQLWQLWVSTYWMAWIPVIVGVLVCVPLGIGVWKARQAWKAADKYDKEDPLILVAFLSVFLLIAAVVTLSKLTTAVAYTIEPRLYALEQLQKLLR